VVATDELKLVVVVATLELKLVIVVPISLVVVATEEDRLDTVVLIPLVVVATLELKLDIVVPIPLVVVAIDDDIFPIELDILELKVEYPVVPVILTCNEPLTTLSVFNFDFIVVLIEDVNEFKLPLAVSNLSILPF
jgi:hypothetical protein